MWVGGDEDLSAGYLVDKEDFYLPDLKLPPEDLALLYVAGSAALAQRVFPYARDLAHAMNKLSFAARAPGASEVAAVAALQLSCRRRRGGRPGRCGAPVGGALDRGGGTEAGSPRLRRGGASRRTERDVDSYGLYQRGGAWFLAGFCLLRQDIRSFHLGRIVSVEVNAAAPR